MGETSKISISSLDLRFSSLRLVSPQQVARVRQSIERDGLKHPVVVSTGVEEGRMVLVDGFKRVKALQELKQSEVAADLVAFDGPASQAALFACNQPVDVNPIEQV